MLVLVIIALAVAVLIPVLLQLWVRWTRSLADKADETPLVTPEIVRSTPGWRFRLPWFRRQHAFLEDAGYEHIGWIDERYHPLFAIKFAVYWNANERSYAVALSVLGRAHFSLLAMAGPYLVRSSRKGGERSVVGPKFYHAGYPDPAQRIDEHDGFLELLRAQYAAHEPPSEGSIPEAITILRARAVRGAETDPGFVFGSYSPEPDDVVIRIQGARTARDVFRAVIRALPEADRLAWRHKESSDAMFDLWSLLSFEVPHGRLVLLHEHYPGVVEREEEYLDLLHLAVWETTHVVVVFEHQLN